MKSKLLTAFLTVAAACGFASEPITLSTPVSHTQGFDQKSDYNDWRSYIRLGLSNSRPNDEFAQMFPDLGVGVRYALPVGALDLSASYTGNFPFSKKDNEKSFFYTLPKASYLLYLAPAKNNSLYGGLGVAFGGLRKADTSEFHGLIPGFTLGYEMNRFQRVLSFVELNISQPALATKLVASPAAKNEVVADATPVAKEETTVVVAAATKEEKTPIFKTVGWDLGPVIQLSAGFGF